MADNRNDSSCIPGVSEVEVMVPNISIRGLFLEAALVGWDR